MCFGHGIGAAIALRFAREGARVAGVDRDRAATQATVKAMGEQSAQGFSVVADVSQASGCPHAVAVARDALGDITLLVNNVGIGGPDMSDEVWELYMAVNVKSHMMMAREFAEQVGPAGGAIVNISSSAALRPAAGGNFAYPASKGAVISLTQRAGCAVWAVQHLRQVHLPGRRLDADGGAQHARRGARPRGRRAGA